MIKTKIVGNKPTFLRLSFFQIFDFNRHFHSLKICYRTFSQELKKKMEGKLRNISGLKNRDMGGE